MYPVTNFVFKKNTRIRVYVINYYYYHFCNYYCINSFSVFENTVEQAIATTITHTPCTRFARNELKGVSFFFFSFFFTIACLAVRKNERSLVSVYSFRPAFRDPGCASRLRVFGMICGGGREVRAGNEFRTGHDVLGVRAVGVTVRT